MDGPAQANAEISKSDNFDDKSAKYGPIIIIIIIIIIITLCGSRVSE